MQQQIFWSLLLLFSWTNSFAQLTTPDEFFPHNIGETFSHHHQIVDYYQYVAENSANVQVEQYGWTNEDRPLIVAYVSTPGNLARLEEIRLNHLRKAKMEDGEISRDKDISIVWLSYSVHGNEAAGTEASPRVLYQLANAENKSTQEWLENTIVILDPAMNPDGYTRYTTWYRQVANRLPNLDQISREHREPWPGGRMNHYYFDLNRDWVWATQKETRQRLPLYQKWLPHIHADLHEQGINSPYYFAPAAQPYHEYLTKWQRDFQTDIGKNHARYFDEEGWLYFTKEVFDLLYPSYGDTYPLFNGGIGMTYEQGGSGRAGREVFLDSGDTLTLEDRISHHVATSLSTVEMGSKSATQLNRNFEKYYQDAVANPVGDYSTFVIKANNSPAKLKKLIELLDRHNIRYGRMDKSKTVLAYGYNNGRSASVNVSSRDLIISAYQPKSTLVQVLFEPEPKVVDSLTYDVTAWSIPLAYGLNAYATSEKLEATDTFDLADFQKNNTTKNAYAYVVDWNAVQSARFLSELLKKGIKVRVARNSANFKEKSITPGTLVITRADNRKLANFDQQIVGIANELEQQLVTINSGFAEDGSDLGSRSYELLTTPQVAVVQSDNTSPYSFGQLWYYFEEDLNYPISVIRPQDLDRLSTLDFDIVILPSGRYAFKDETIKSIDNWTRSGGKFIAIGSALRSLANKPGFKLKNSPPKAKNGGDNLANKTISYAQQQRNSISDRIPGAIFKIKLDNTHPLAFGMPDYYFSLKTGTLRYDLLSDSWNIGYVDKKANILGFAGSNAKRDMQNSMVFAVTERGRGNTIYMVDNPLFRGFWEQGKLLFSNALFLVE
ncbi:MAG: M14 family metallopeptidase [Saprospiraceae bacterium]